MSNSTLISTIKSIPAGRFFRMSYKSELPVKAAFKKQGISIIKVTDTTVRTGVSYNSIASVQEYKSTHEPSGIVRTNNYVWVEQDRLKHNTVTGKDYFVIAPMKNSHPKSTYIVKDNNGERYVTIDELDKSMIQDSYWKPSNGVPTAIRTICLENIIELKV